MGSGAPGDQARGLPLPLTLPPASSRSTRPFCRAQRWLLLWRPPAGGAGGGWLHPGNKGKRLGKRSPFGPPFSPRALQPPPVPWPKRRRGRAAAKGQQPWESTYTAAGAKERKGQLLSHTPTMSALPFFALLTKCMFLRLDKPATRATADPCGKGCPTSG